MIRYIINLRLVVGFWLLLSGSSLFSQQDTCFFIGTTQADHIFSVNQVASSNIDSLVTQQSIIDAIISRFEILPDQILEYSGHTWVMVDSIAPGGKEVFMTTYVFDLSQCVQGGIQIIPDTVIQIQPMPIDSTIVLQPDSIDVPTAGFWGLACIGIGLMIVGTQKLKEEEIKEDIQCQRTS